MSLNRTDPLGIDAVVHPLRLDVVAAQVRARHRCGNHLPHGPYHHPTGAVDDVVCDGRVALGKHARQCDVASNSTPRHTPAKRHNRKLQRLNRRLRTVSTKSHQPGNQIINKDCHLCETNHTSRERKNCRPVKRRPNASDCAWASRALAKSALGVSPPAI